ncbi:Uma2 family endonuclease [Actinacidiphila alni]|uniref:Uma2 family endonuclease n=1 Tax=Actinacidiphila alni TaxID=380248 RepID=UPI0033F7950C
MEGQLTAEAGTAGRRAPFHTLARYLMTSSLRRTLPGHLWVRRDAAVVVDDRTAAEPDIVVVDAETDQVVLAVEVVPADGEAVDGEADGEGDGEAGAADAAQTYATAGIAHFWRVEQDPVTDRPMVYVHERDAATGAYALTGVHREELAVPVPYRITVDLTGIDHL